ncbi:unnamed protein product [Brassica rapa subsp. narinosa]|uniref:(rape) hypothetical protein n=1 Tax=Brassica napus TaxID=3708 RepID=A0A816RJC3_BRANA|nr:unnamed protein product [Brassica napus]
MVSDSIYSYITILLHNASLELRLLTTLMLVLDVFLCLPEFKHRHGEVKADLAAACLIPFFWDFNCVLWYNL